MSEPGQTAYEAYARYRLDATGVTVTGWSRLVDTDRDLWATIEQACLDKLPAGGHETTAADLLGSPQLRNHPNPEVVASSAVAHAILGLCDIIRTAIAADA